MSYQNYKNGSWTVKNNRKTVQEHLSRPVAVKMFQRGEVDEYCLEEVIKNPQGEEVARVAGDDVFDWFAAQDINMFDALKLGYTKETSYGK